MTARAEAKAKAIRREGGGDRGVISELSVAFSHKSKFLALGALCNAVNKKQTKKQKKKKTKIQYQ